MKLNIGCGFVKREGYINIDKSKIVNPDKVVNVEEGLPFPDNYFDEIYSSHSLEHIHPQYFGFVLEEIYRVAKPSCLLHLILPFDNIKSRTDLNHYRTFSWWSFLPLEVDMQNGRYNYFSTLKLRRKNKFPNKFIRFFYILFPWVINEIEFKYEIIKHDKNLQKNG